MKDRNLLLPDNRPMAWNRLKTLKKRLESSETYCQHYVEFMNEVIDSGYAEKVPEQGDSHRPQVHLVHSSPWRVPSERAQRNQGSFDCSVQYQRQSLNSLLLQGPNLMNNLTGVLCRFRREPIALMCGIEAMFYQVRVLPEDRDLLRFLWWENGDT